MVKRTAGWLLCLLLVFQMAAVPARAEGPVYFLAAGNEVQTVSDQTMPFWSGGYLYIPGSLFTGTNRSTLGITYRYQESDQVGVLFNDDMSILLLFDLKRNYTIDLDEKISYPGAIVRDGTLFVPAFLVAKYFGVEYSVTEVKNGFLVWIRQQNFGLTDKEFADAATYPIAGKYAEYMAEKQTENPSVEPPDDGVEIDGKRIYLCMEAGEDTARMLDALDRYGAQGAFFCTAGFMKEQAGLLRRMAASGHSIGILADAADGTLTLSEQLQKANEALERATCGRTRLVRIQNSDEQSIWTAQSAGYRVLVADLDESVYGLRNSARAETLLKRVSDYRGAVDIWLGSQASYTGLRAFLEAAEKAEGRCLAWTETA